MESFSGQIPTLHFGHIKDMQTHLPCFTTQFLLLPTGNFIKSCSSSPITAIFDGPTIGDVAFIYIIRTAYTIQLNSCQTTVKKNRVCSISNCEQFLSVKLT